MQTVQTQALTPPPPRPDSGRASKEAAEPSPRATRNPPDTTSMWEEQLGEDLAALYAGLPMQQAKEESVATLDDEPMSEIDEELAAMLDASAPEHDEEIVVARAVEPPSQKATFEPSTRMQAGKVTWEGRFSALPHALLVHETFAALSGRH